MNWFNYYGLVVMAVIMIPNIVYAANNKGGDADANIRKAIVIAEQIGRYGCFFFMIFNIPHTYFDFWFDNALTVYLAVNGVLCVAYLVFWLMYRNTAGLTRALSLSVIPTCIFLFSGIVVASVPLIVLSVVFGASHIYISVKNRRKV